MQQVSHLDKSDKISDLSKRSLKETKKQDKRTGGYCARGCRHSTLCHPKFLSLDWPAKAGN